MALPSKPRVVIVGRGKLSSSLLKNLTTTESLYEALPCEDLGDLHALPPKSIFCLVHAGSGRLLADLLYFCSLHGTSLIQASTGIGMKQTENNDDLASARPSFVFLEAPNLSVPIVKFMHLMEQASRLFATYDVEIKESHQSTKKTVPGTALVMARSFGKGLDDIVSIRDHEAQLQLGIPSEHLDAHAAHWITVQGGGCELSFQSKVFSHKTYSLGLVEILNALIHLQEGRYHVLDLVRKGLL